MKKNDTEDKFCPCGLLAVNGEFCAKHLKSPLKPKNEKRGEFRGKSKYQEEVGMFKRAME